jgi:hypothetical protein
MISGASVERVPMRKRPHLPAFLGVLAALLAGCGAHPPEPDLPAPPSEPRATLHLRVDLVRGQRCDEAFDLALYQDRGVELIEWDAGTRCEERAVSIHYLSRRTTPELVLRAAQAAAAKVSPIPGESR